MEITTLFIAKTLITILFVLLLSLIAEYINPKISGIISGIPTGTALILFFYGLEQGPEFASESSLFNLVGMLSMQVFIFIYLKISTNNTRTNMLISSLVAIIGYVIIILFLKQFQFNLITALIIPIISIPLFNYLFEKINNTVIKDRIKLSTKVLFVRAILASIVIISVTSIAHLIGPEWAGLFSAFPTTLFPLILIVHNTYGREHVHTIIKNVPKGQWCIVIYIISIFFLYPSLGIYVGTLIAFFLVTFYLVALFKLYEKL